MRLSFFLFIALISFFKLNAQQAVVVSGFVEDLQGNKLIGAGVFINGSRFSTSTNNEGSYSLSLLPGSYELGVKMIGFKTKVVKIVIDNQSLKVDFKLAEEITSLAEVTIRSGPPNPKYLNQFTELFIGTTANATLCKILNPEVIVFDYDKVLSKLTARTTDFLIIENEALGYKVKYIVESFVYEEEKKRVAYKGSSYFEDLDGTITQQKKWNLNRIAAYNGSPRHFFSSLYKGELKKDGFNVLKIINKPNADRPADSLIKANIKRLMLSKQTETGLVDLSKGDSLNYWMKQKSKPLFFKELISQQVLADTLVQNGHNQLKKITAKDQMYIAYTKASEEMGYRESLDPLFRKALNLPRAQVSMIKLLEPVAYLSSNGNLVDPQSIYFGGYWGWKNVADLLPSDFIPVPNN
jgi:hypothetical protein